MYTKEFRPIARLLVGVGGFFLLIDQLLKWAARSRPDFQYYIFGKWLGWEYMANSGIAFSLPFPNWLLVLITPPIILVLILWFIKSYRGEVVNCYLLIANCLIISGAVSNFVDRVLFSATIDYLRILTGVINLADVMIVAGVGLLVVVGWAKGRMQPLS